MHDEVGKGEPITADASQATHQLCLMRHFVAAQRSGTGSHSHLAFACRLNAISNAIDCAKFYS
jgi:hypothetical protein